MNTTSPSAPVRLRDCFRDFLFTVELLPFRLFTPEVTSTQTVGGWAPSAARAPYSGAVASNALASSTGRLRVAPKTYLRSRR
jgi:hypothetical protein